MGIAVVLAFFLGMVVLAIRAPRTALLAMVFFAPWSGLNADFGLQISAYQLTIIAVVLVTLARSLQPGWRPARPAAVRVLAGLVLFATLWSLLQLAFLPNAEIQQSGLRGPLVRAPIQIFVFALALSPALLIAWSMRTADDLKSLLKAYLWSAAVLAAIGWFQLIVWYATGSNPIPIGIVDSLVGGAARERTASFDFAALAINRMNSLAGEPRQLGGAMVFAMLLLQAVMLTARRVDWRRLGPFWAFFAVTAVPTYSTSAIALWVIGTVVQIVATPLFGVRIERSLRQLVGALLIVVVPFGMAIAGAEASGIPVVDLFASRTIERIDANGAVEDFDLAILDWLRSRPADAVLGAGLGNAHLYAAPFLGLEFRWYAEGNVFTAKPGYLRTLSELGLAGLLLLLVWYGVLMVDAARLLRRPGNAALAPLIPIAAMTLAEYMATTAVVGEFWCMGGVLAVAVTAMRGSSRQQPRAVPVGHPVLA